MYINIIYIYICLVMLMIRSSRSSITSFSAQLGQLSNLVLDRDRMGAGASVAADPFKVCGITQHLPEHAFIWMITKEGAPSGSGHLVFKWVLGERFWADHPHHSLSSAQALTWLDTGYLPCYSPAGDAEVLSELQMRCFLKDYRDQVLSELQIRYFPG